MKRGIYISGTIGLACIYYTFASLTDKLLGDSTMNNFFVRTFVGMLAIQLLVWIGKHK